ncbi:hypothetical protein [Flavivirga spongiicola]|uniref:DUF2569 family protein n=1 Tax=Flavivirga spongiicola TaxID=421621 RepID=A0ABU7XY37_9FLAO|nr:hypothetical protein [Flavivirga sp. MEBiC05379]MDO5980458.1 hypothetical protein [Flavivirga sp. MEBiC05379]
MKNSLKSKIALTNLISFLGILIVWIVELLTISGNQEEKLINRLSQLFTELSHSLGFLAVIIFLLLILMAIDYIVLNSKNRFKHHWGVIIFQCLILSSPFLYWIIKSDFNRGINIFFIFIIFITQYIRKQIIRKIKVKQEGDFTK